MNLGFWIAWFRYQKLKIFPFEGHESKEFCREKGSSLSLQVWFEGLRAGLKDLFFLPMIELKSAKMRDLIEDEIRRKWASF